MRTTKGALGVFVALSMMAGVAHAKDLGDILLNKGLITPEELQQAREESKQKAAADERRETILAKLPKWLDYFTPFGDLRTRYEGFYANELRARNRFRARVRFGTNVNPTDEVGATIRLASGNPNDPISTNQDLTKTEAPWPINLDWAYLTVKPGKTFNIEPGWFTLLAGKFAASTAVYRTSELVWDDDLSPEGAAEALNLLEQRDGFFRNVKINGVQWVVDEVAAASDPWMYGGQLVTDMAPVLDDSAKWTFAVADYHYASVDEVASRYLSPFTGNADPVTGYTSNPNQNAQLVTSNTLTLSAPDVKGHQKVTGFATNFNILDFTSELNFADPFGYGVPAGVFGDLAYNSQADTRNTGFYVGAGIGKAGKDWYHDNLLHPGDWGASYTYVWVEKDANFSMFSYSDGSYVRSFTSSTTSSGQQSAASNVTMHILRFDYMLFQNFQLTAKVHFVNALDRSIATTTIGQPLNTPGNETLVRSQLDVMLRF